MSKIVVLGSGKTGRGFLARLLTESDYPFILMDQDEQLLDRIKNGYEISFFDGRETIFIKPYKCISTKRMEAKEYIKQADTIFVSVGVENLSNVCCFLKGNLKENVQIFLCENGSGIKKKVEEALQKTSGIIPAAVFCTTIEADQKGNILSETYHTLPCENVTTFPFLEGYSDFTALMVRKLYTYNAASAVICYLGLQKGYKYLAEAANDKDIKDDLLFFYEEIGKALCAEYRYTQESQKQFADNSLKKFTSYVIADTLERNGRNPKKKLAPEERLIGSLRLIQKHGGDTSVLERTIAAAFEYPLDQQWKEEIEENGVEKTLRQVCKLEMDNASFDRILEEYQILKLKKVTSSAKEK